MKPSLVNRAVSLVRIAGKHPVHTERETFRACVMQTAIPEDGRCCFCAPLPCRFRRVPVTLVMRRASAPFHDVIFQRSTPATEGVVEGCRRYTPHGYRTTTPTSRREARSGRGKAAGRGGRTRHLRRTAYGLRRNASYVRGLARGSNRDAVPNSRTQVQRTRTAHGFS